MTFLELLDKMKGAPGSILTSELVGLSGISSRQVKEAHDAVARLQPAERRQVLKRLVDVAEDDPLLDFTPIFKRFLDDPDSGARQAAVDGLWEDEEGDTAVRVANLLEGDPDAGVRASAASSLGHFALLAELEEIDERLAGRVRSALLRAAANQSESLEVQRRAIESVSFISDEEIARLIEETYRHPDPKTQASAIRAMGNSGLERWFDTILKELGDPNPELRYEAAVACGEFEDQRAVPSLARLVADPDPEVRFAAIASLGKVGGKEVRQTLQRLLDSPDEAVQEAAGEALEEMEGFEAPLRFRLFEEGKGGN